MLRFVFKISLIALVSWVMILMNNSHHEVEARAKEFWEVEEARAQTYKEVDVAKAEEIESEIEEDESLGCSLPKVFDWTNDDQQVKWERVLGYCEDIEIQAKRRNLDPYLVAAVIWWESGGDPNVISSSGAVGLMQVMPSDGLAGEHPCKCFSDRPLTNDLKEPSFNIGSGTGVLRFFINKYGSLRNGLMHYGPANVGFYYADRILDLHSKIQNETGS